MSALRSFLQRLCLCSQAAPQAIAELPAQPAIDAFDARLGRLRPHAPAPRAMLFVRTKPSRREA
jgi:hypothetical protein